MYSRLNPQALNDKWGGVICLELGSTKPENFNEILSILKTIIDTKEHYIISVFDVEDNMFLGDCEIVASTEEGRYTIQNIRITTKYHIKVYSYSFLESGTYTRTAPTEYFGDVLGRLLLLESDVKHIKETISEITVTE